MSQARCNHPKRKTGLGKTEASLMASKSMTLVREGKTEYAKEGKGDEYQINEFA